MGTPVVLDWGIPVGKTGGSEAMADCGGGGLVEVEGGPDISDTRLIGLGALPELLRRL